MKKKANFLNAEIPVNIPTYINTDIVNTFIGRVGSVVTTPAQLAAKSNGTLTEAQITNFQIDDLYNIACLIETNWTVGINAFGGGNYWASHFIDVDGYVTNMLQGAFQQNALLKIFYSKLTAQVGGGNNSRQFRQDTLMEVWYSRATAMGFTNSTSQQIFLGTGNCDIFLNKFLETASTNIYARGNVRCVGVLAGDTVTINGLVYTAVAGVKADNTEFSIDTSNNACAADLRNSIDNDVRVGTIGDVHTVAILDNLVTMDTDVLGFAGNATTLTSSNGTRLPVTVFSGGYDANYLEPDIKVAQDAGSNLIFLDYTTDLDTPPPPTALSGSNITNTSVNISFTPPTTLFGIYRYEVWLNGSFYTWINASGDTVSGLASHTAHKIKLVTCDIYYNRSAYSDEILVTTLRL